MAAISALGLSRLGMCVSPLSTLCFGPRIGAAGIVRRHLADHQPVERFCQSSRHGSWSDGSDLAIGAAARGVG